MLSKHVFEISKASTERRWTATATRKAQDDAVLAAPSPHTVMFTGGRSGVLWRKTQTSTNVYEGRSLSVDNNVDLWTADEREEESGKNALTMCVQSV